jgi:hypothetical protein
VDLERGPLSLVSAIEELLGKKSSGSGPESREYGRRDPSRWPRGTLYQQRLALTSPTTGGRLVGLVRSRTQATEFSFGFSVFRLAVMHVYRLDRCSVCLHVMVSVWIVTWRVDLAPVYSSGNHTRMLDIWNCACAGRIEPWGECPNYDAIMKQILRNKGLVCAVCISMGWSLR